jgi:hypothetical protein
MIVLGTRTGPAIPETQMRPLKSISPRACARAAIVILTVALVLASFESSTAEATVDSATRVRSIIDDIQAFWEKTLPSVYGQQYEPIPEDHLYPYSAADPPPACGSTGTTPYEDVADNAFYCSDGDFVAWDEQSLIP